MGKLSLDVQLSRIVAVYTSSNLRLFHPRINRTGVSRVFIFLHDSSKDGKWNLAAAANGHSYAMIEVIVDRFAQLCSFPAHL